MTTPLRWARAAIALLVVMVATACQVRTEVALDVRSDGSGSVTVSVGLDRDALSRGPDLGQALRLDDLRATGWTVGGPVPDDSGFTVVRVSKPFSGPEEAAVALSEIAGPGGAFRDFRITADRSFARSTVSFAGLVDLRAGLAAFSDGQLAQLLDGKPLGDDLPAIEARLGSPIDDVFRFSVAARLPGQVTSNAPTESGGAVVWDGLRLSSPNPVLLGARAVSWRPVSAATAAVTVGSLVLLLVLLARRLRRRPSHP
ncbi:MAG: hypothetical protein ACT4PW_14780 [Acidimicrobiia bacterium]